VVDQRAAVQRVRASGPTAGVAATILDTTATSTDRYLRPMGSSQCHRQDRSPRAMRWNLEGEWQ
jgi:hypothetical protein